jgi:hypothetical protein
MGTLTGVSVVSNNGESGGEGEDAEEDQTKMQMSQEALIRMMKETRISTGADYFHIYWINCESSPTKLFLFS